MSERKMPVEVWTRVVGYFRPINNYNPGKLAEFRQRVFFRLPSSAELDLIPDVGKMVNKLPAK